MEISSINNIAYCQRTQAQVPKSDSVTFKGTHITIPSSVEFGKFFDIDPYLFEEIINNATLGDLKVIDETISRLQNENIPLPVKIEAKSEEFPGSEPGCPEYYNWMEAQLYGQTLKTKRDLCYKPTQSFKKLCFQVVETCEQEKARKEKDAIVALRGQILGNAKNFACQGIEDMTLKVKDVIRVFGSN